jgi:hypothetical protein
MRINLSQLTFIRFISLITFDNTILVYDVKYVNHVSHLIYGEHVDLLFGIMVLVCAGLGNRCSSMLAYFNSKSKFMPAESGGKAH